MMQRVAIVLLLLALALVAFDFLLPVRSETLGNVSTVSVIGGLEIIERINFSSMLGDSVVIYRISNPTGEARRIENLSLEGKNFSLQISLAPNAEVSIGIIRDFTVVLLGGNASLLDLIYYPSNRWLEVGVSCSSEWLELLVFGDGFPSRVGAERSVKWGIDAMRGATWVRFPCSVQRIVLDFTSYPYADVLVLDRRMADLLRYEIAKLTEEIEALEGEVDAKQAEISLLLAEIANLSESINQSVEEKNRLALSLAALRSSLGELNQSIAEERQELERSLLLPYPFALVIAISLVALLLYVASLLYSKGDRDVSS